MDINEILKSHGVGVGKKLVGDAQPSDVLSDKTFSNAEGNNKVGTMLNQGQKILTPGIANVAIPSGYHDGTGYVFGDADLVASNIKNNVNLFGVTGNFASNATAVAGDILSTKTAYVGANELIGTMTNNGAYNITPGVSNATIPQGYHSGAGVVYGDADLVANNIVTPANIFGVAGAAVRETSRVLMASQQNPVGFSIKYDLNGYASLVTNTSGNVYSYKFTVSNSDTVVVSTSNPIDITNFTYLIIIFVPVTADYFGYLRFGFGTSNVDTNLTAYYNCNTSATYVYQLGISSLSGSYYPKWVVNNNSGSGYIYGLVLV